MNATFKPGPAPEPMVRKGAFTDNERAEVARLLAAGATHYEIGQRLGRAESSVSNYLKNISGENINSRRLSELLRVGTSCEEIAEILGKTPSMILDACRRRGWPRPGSAGAPVYDYGFPPPPPPPPSSDCISHTGGRYTLIREWAERTGVSMAYAMQQYHRAKAAQHRAA